MSELLKVAERVFNTPLLISRSKADVLVAVLGPRMGIGALQPGASRFEGDDVVRDENGRAERGEFGALKRKPYRVTDAGVGVISIVGSLVNRGAWVGASSGLTSYEGIQHQIKSAQADAEVRSVILDLHTPGGEAVGAFETAALVRELSAVKHTVAIINGMACSAGYAIASGAGEIVSTETGVSGSIGVVLLHADFSRKLDREGVRPTLIHAGAHKVDGNPFEPLSAEVREALQGEVNSFYEVFLTTVAMGRGSRLTADAARKTEARSFIGAAAVASGLADRVGSFESVLAELSTRGASRSFNATSKGHRMANENEPGASGFTQEQMNAAVSAARTEASASGAKAERDRFKAVFGHEAYAGREASAHHMLLTTDMSAEAITGVLAGLPAAAAPAPEAPKDRAKDAPGGLATVDPASGAQADAGKDHTTAWSKSIERVNARIG